MQKNSKVFARLPAAGLGNKMLVWARAFVFSRQYGMELFVSAWWGINAGAWLRLEKKKRVYLGTFKEDSLRKRSSLFLFRLRARSVTEPAFDSIQEERAGSIPDQKTLYIFEKLFTDADYFKELRPWREEIREEIHRMLFPALRTELDSLESPVIGIHVRRGDFKRGSTLTPEEFFVRAIEALRETAGKELPVTVFTDAEPGELTRLFSLPSVKVATPKADLLDILLLSRSRICILSISSSFSLWAGFLSEGIVLQHPDEWHPVLRPSSVNEKHYEGRFDPSGNMDLRLREQLTRNF